MTIKIRRYLPYKKIQWLLVLLCVVFNSLTYAATYNLTSGSYPPCNTSWSVSGTTYTCNGNGRVTLASGDILTSNTTITISANNGFSLNNSTIGSSGNRINLTSTYGTHDALATTTIWGNLTSEAVITLAGTTVNGTITTNGNINLTGGSVTGLIRSNSNTITTNGTNLSGGATAHSGMSITGGTISGSFTLTSNNPATFTGVTMTSGSISGASRVTIQGGSVFGSGSSSISVSTTSNEINVNNSTVYGNLTAASSATVNVTNGAVVYGTCMPNSTPANACGPAPLPPTPMNCSDGTSSGITGYYFNNRTLTEPSAASRSDAPIDFNWGGAAPGASGINADNFSVRWTGYIRVTQTGTYRFQTESDDGVRLFINGNSVIDRWNDHSATTDTTGDINLVAGNTYSITLQYYENGGDAVIRLRWRLPGSTTYVAIPGGPLPTMGAGLYECTPAPKTPISSCATNLSAGITADYFNNQTLANPVTSKRWDSQINFDWGTGVPGPTGVAANNFSVRWEGYIHVTQSGVHRFQTNSDDGVRLTVNGDLLIDQWNDHSVTTHTSGAINLIAGNSYPIKLEFYENGGYAVAQLRWQTPGSASYVAIPSGVNASTISAPGLYECVTTPAAYSFIHNATGITCAAESVTVTALNSSGVAYNPPVGTEVTLSTDPATGTWVGGTNPFVFTGAESSFTRYLRQTTPGVLTIRAASTTASSTSTITFANTGLKIAQSFAASSPTSTPIATQVAGVVGNAIVKAVKTDDNTGACAAMVGTGVKSVAMAYTCNNPIACVSGQTLSIKANSAPLYTNVASNNNGAAPGSYTDVNLNFDANGEAPINFIYSDVGQITLHGRLPISASGNNPAITLIGSSDPFVVKPKSIVVSGVQRTDGTANPGATNAPGTAAQFVAAGEQFRVLVAAMNGATPAAITPNFGREITPETQFLKIKTNSIVYPIGGTPTELTVGGSITATTTQGVFSYDDVRWNQVGSITIEPHFDDGSDATTDDGYYLGADNIDSLVPSSTIGRFYPNKYALVNTDTIKTCSAFHYMGKIFNLEDNDPQTKGLVFKLQALDAAGNSVTNYDIAKGYAAAAVDFYTFSGSTDLSSRLVDDLGNILTPGSWVNGEININHPAAQFGRAATPDGPYTDVTIGVGIEDCLDKRLLEDKDLTVDTTGGVSCDAPEDNAYELTKFDARFGRLRLDDAFGPETAALPVNFATEYWVGSFFAPNTDDSSCTKILRSAITYPAGSILTPANLQVSLGSGTTTGSYASITATEIEFSSGNAQHSFSAPTGGAQGQFNVEVDLAAYPWLRFDWNQDGNYSDTSLPTARFGFGSYRGHDRVIYWRERFN